MISMLKGSVAERLEGEIILDVNGVGYLISLPKNSIFFLNDENDEVKIFTHMTVREDAMSLYGFEDRRTLDFFRKLILVNGVGPKAALAILEISDIDNILSAIVNKDAAFISEAKGIGKKTSDRICLELHDKLGSMIDSSIGVGEPGKKIKITSNRRDAIDALIGLGYKEFEAKKLVEKIDDDSLSTEEYIREALKA